MWQHLGSMSRMLRSIPAALAAVLLAAHFFRGGAIVLAGVCLAGTALAFVGRRWSALAVRAGLAVGAIVWAFTAVRIARARMTEGLPYTRMLVILGAVALFTACAAWLVPRVETARDPGEPS